MTDYVKKIKNCLALAKSPNENEARSALLMARKLMAKYKISKKDLNDESEQEVAKELTGVTYSVRRDPWIADLANTIAEYHCCKSFQSREKRKQVAEIGFIGLTDDVPMCMETFKYAVKYIRSVTDKLRKKSDVSVADGYGFGFVTSLYTTYHKQQEENNWGLILSVPDAVTNITNGLKKCPKHIKQKTIDGKAFTKGFNDGRNFNSQKKICD